MRALPLTLALCAVLWTTVGHAAEGPSDADKAAAKNHYEQGRRLYDRQRYLEAVPEFEQGYQLTGDPVFLYNIAQAYRLANRLDEAMHYYTTYLKRDPDTPRRAEVERRLEELRRAKEPPNQVGEPSGKPGAPERGEAPSPVAPYTAQPGYWGPPAQPYAYPGPQAAPGAQYPAPAPGYQYPSPAPAPATFDQTGRRGLQLRLGLGLGGGLAVAERFGQTIALSGFAAMLTLRAGFYLKPKLALWLQYGNLAVVDPSISDQTGTTVQGEGTMYFHHPLGLGASYYVAPTLALSGALHLYRLALEAKTGERSETDLGSGLFAELAKEFPLGRALNLALALQATLSVATSSVDVTYSGMSLLVAGMIGYN